MKNLKTVALLVLLFISSVSANADKYYFEQISLHEGLSQSTVKAIFRDHIGMLWIGTREGLNRYDGQSIRTYLNDPKNPNSLPHNNIFFIAEDSQNRLWIGTGGILCRYDRLSDSFIPEKINDRDISLKNIFVSDDFMYSTNGNTLHIYNSKKNEWSEKIFSGAETNLTASCKIDRFDKNHLLIGSRWKGLFLCETSTGKLTRSTFTQSGGILDVFSTPEGHFWISEYGKAPQCFDRSGQKLYDISTADSYLKADKVMDICSYHNKIWMVSDGEGIITYDQKNGSLQRVAGQNDKHGTAQVNSLLTIYPDKYGNLWLGAIRSGLLNIKNTFASSYSNSPLNSEWGLSDATVLSFYQDEENKIWIGTDGQGINLFEPDKEKFTHFQNSFGTKVSSITAYSDQYLLLSLYKAGLKLFDKKTGQLTDFQLTGKNGEYIKTNDLLGFNVFANENGKIFISDDHLYLYDTEKREALKIRSSIKEDGALRIHSNTFLKNELLVYANTVFSLIDSKTGREKSVFRIPNNYITVINAVEYSADSILWIGLSSGLIKYDLRTKKATQIMPDRLKSISTIQLDAKNTLWIGSGISLYRYNIQTDQIYKYAKADGITANEYLPKSKLLGLRGNIYMGGVSGMSVIQSDIPFPEIAEPQFELLDILLDGSQLAPKRISKSDKKTTIKLPWNFTSLQLNFFINTPGLRSHPRYRYLIEGFSTQYLEPETQSIRIQNLNPGSYRIMLQYELKNQVWSTPFSIAHIRVSPPWWQTWWFYLIVIIALTFTLLRIRRSVIVKTKQSMEFEMQRRENELSEQKIRFLINVSHELRTPLTLIYAPLRRLLKDENTPKVLKPVLTLMYKHVKNMKNMIDMVLDVRKMEKNSDMLNLINHHFNNWVQEVADDFSFEFEARNIQLIITKDERITDISFDRERCNKVLSNLLMNAIKFSDAGSTVTITTELLDSKVKVCVTDSGMGVPAEERDKLFSRFYQGRHEKGGSGIGLSYAKTQIEMHKGEIGYEPAQPKGSTFWFSLPLQAHFNTPKQSIENELQNLSTQSMQTINASETDFNFKEMTLLIAEDEPDLLSYMHESLSEYFGKVIAATNGQEALEKIREHMPDMLISDVMMPGMDGFELCKTIKSDVNISHIPVVLLTALSDDESSLTGYKMGADLYLAKPFGVDLLLAATANILRQRLQLRTQFSTTESEVGIDEITYSNADEKFLNKLNDYISEHLSDNELRIDNVASEMAMSRTTFYNKVKILTGLTANNYVTDFKIKKATKMLLNKDLPIQEIAFELGYVSQRYFSTVFKQQTGLTPTQYREKHEKLS